MKKLTFAIVGRPNVGKSSLFNRIAKKRLSIVDEKEGVTRDRLYCDVEAFGVLIRLIDTGGIDIKGDLPFFEEVKAQSEKAVLEADGVILVVDSRVEVLGEDREIARWLLKSKKPLFLAVNKVDTEEMMHLVSPFYSLGIENLIPISTLHGLGIADLLEEMTEVNPSLEKKEESDPLTRIAIVGRPNVGKSTLINTLLSEKRCVVGKTAGTTRDSIDISVKREGDTFILVDTAGIREKKKEKEAVDKFASIRTRKSIERSDLALLVIDANDGVTSKEKVIARSIQEEGKGCILYFNKWDEVKNVRMEHAEKRVREDLPFLSHCPLLFGSALTGRNVEELFPLFKKVFDAYSGRLSTGKLNGALRKAVTAYPPPMIGGKRLKIYYGTQIRSMPPRFVLFVNSPHLLKEPYKKYLLKKLREREEFTGSPLVLHIRKRPSTKKADRSKGAETLYSIDESALEDL